MERIIFFKCFSHRPYTILSSMVSVVNQVINRLDIVIT